MWCQLPKTHVVSDLDVSVFLQQRRNQTMTLPLADVVQSCVTLLYKDTDTRHKVTASRAAGPPHCQRLLQHLFQHLRV